MQEKWRKSLAVLMACLVFMGMFLGWNPIKSVQAEDVYFSGGSGTKENPYLISSKSDLEMLSKVINIEDASISYKTAYYYQTNDINLNNEAWAPIGIQWNGSDYKSNLIFSGYYDGGGHTVSGLNVIGSYMYAGLFGRIGSVDYGSAIVKNLHVEGNVSPTYSLMAGGICGEIGEGSSVLNCSFSGTVSGVDADGIVGGVVGKIYRNGTVKNCYFNGTLYNKSNHSTAGVVGKASIEYGYNYLYNCYATGSIENTEYSGGVIRIDKIDNGANLNIKNCYYSFENDIKGINKASSVTGDFESAAESISKSDLQTKGADLLGYAFTSDVNKINDGYPIIIYQNYKLNGYGTKAEPYQVSSKEDIFYLSDAVNSEIGVFSYYIQTTDIDMENEELRPIGTYTDYNTGTGFQGKYNGQYHSILNINVVKKEKNPNFAGLFGWVSGGIVENLIVRGNINCKSSYSVGGIAGEVAGEAIVRNCAFIGNINSLYMCGGISGDIWGSATISNCYFNGVLTSVATDSELNKTYANFNTCGGITGRVSCPENWTAKMRIENCYAVAEMKVTSDLVVKSGIAGTVNSSVKDGFLTINNTYYLDSMCIGAVNDVSYDNCTPLSQGKMISCAQQLGSPFVTNTNENLNDGYPVFEWQVNQVPTKPNVNTGWRGKGTAENPYQITSVKDLNRLSDLINDEATNPLFRYAHYIQVNDIDLTGVDFMPIGIYYGSDGNTTSNAVFAGSYDGNYHKITNLDMTYSNEYCGLFGRVGEYNHDNSNCVIKNLSVTGNVACYADSGRAGGIVGELAYGASIKNCDFHGTVEADGKAGSIVGFINCGGEITACYSDANIITSSTDSSIGGIVGEILVGKNDAVGSSNAKITGTYYNGTLTENHPDATGAICGKIVKNGEKSIQFDTNFFLSTSYSSGVENKTVSGCTKLSEIALKACADMLGSPYLQNDDSKLNHGYPVFEWQSEPYNFLGDGTASNPYQISSKAELEHMRNLINSDYFNKTYGHAYYIQTANIDLENDTWTPIGIGYDKDGTFYSTKVFYGHYNGNKKYIRNFNGNGDVVEAGLFGIIDGTESAEVQNLVVYGMVTSTTVSHAGGIAGKICNNATIDGCGFVGDINISTSNASAGGIVGIATNGGTIANCYHNGKVVANEISGGVLGQSEFVEQGILTIENCYQANGEILASGFAGSIAGNCTVGENIKGILNIINCYCTNDTETSASSKNATTDNTLTLSKSLLKKAADDLGNAYSANTDANLNDGYPVYQWELFTSTVKGDVNNDGMFTIVDIVCLQRWLMNDKRVVLNCWENGDFLEDNTINVLDLSLMKRNLISKH